jgi:NAD+ diphosphatase
MDLRSFTPLMRAAGASRTPCCPVPWRAPAGARARPRAARCRHARCASARSAALQPVGLLGERYCQAGWVDDEALAPEAMPGAACVRCSASSTRPCWAWPGARRRSPNGRAPTASAAPAQRHRCAAWRTNAASSAELRAPGLPAHFAGDDGPDPQGRQGAAGDARGLARETLCRWPVSWRRAKSIEEAVHREVFEEVGCGCTNLRYFGSQSWPFPHSLMIAFTADYRTARSVDPTRSPRRAGSGRNDEWPERVPHVSCRACWSTRTGRRGAR